MTGLFTNQERKISGAKLVLLMACALAAAWLLRDLVTNRELSEWHTVLLSFLLTIGAANRMSARKRLLKFDREGATIDDHEN